MRNLWVLAICVFGASCAPLGNSDFKNAKPEMFTSENDTFTAWSGVSHSGYAFTYYTKQKPDLHDGTGTLYSHIAPCGQFELEIITCTDFGHGKKGSGGWPQVGVGCAFDEREFCWLYEGYSGASIVLIKDAPVAVCVNFTYGSAGPATLQLGDKIWPTTKGPSHTIFENDLCTDQAATEEIIVKLHSGIELTTSYFDGKKKMNVVRKGGGLGELYPDALRMLKFRSEVLRIEQSTQNAD